MRQHMPPDNSGGAAREDVGTHWPTAFLVIWTGACGAIALGKVPAAMGLIRAEMGLSLIEAGWIASVFNCLSVACSVFFGLLLARWNPLQTATAGAVVLISGGLLAIVVSGKEWMLVSRVVEGVGFLTMSVSLPTLIDSITQPKDKRIALSLWAINLPLGAGIGMVATPWLAELGGWRLAWAVFDAMLLCALLLLWSARKYFVHRLQTRLHASPALLLTQLRVLKQSAVWRYGLAFMLYTTMLWSAFVWLPTLLRIRPDLSASDIALMSASVVLANVPGNLFGTMLLGRGVPRDVLMCVALVAMALFGGLIFGLGTTTSLAYVLCIAFSFAGGIVPPATLSSSATLAQGPVQVGIVQGYFVQIANAGQMLGPLLVAWMVGREGNWSVALWIFVGGGLLTCLLFYVPLSSAAVWRTVFGRFRS